MFGHQIFMVGKRFKRAYCSLYIKKYNAYKGGKNMAQYKARYSHKTYNENE